jgi:basic membrane protein A and related proteins
MSKIRVITLLLIVVMVVGIVPLSAQEGEIETVCLVTDIGRINDGTFNQFAYDGLLVAAEDFELEIDYIETVSETDYEVNIDTCVNEGFDVIVTVGYLIGDATVAAAEENPDIFFIGVDQFIMDGPENMVGIQFREDQAAFLVGVLAAMVTETDVVAGVYGMEIPPVVKFRNGFEQGIAYVDEDIEVLGVYIADFYAPDQGASAAEQFMGEGADVIFGAGGPTGSGGILAAAAEGVWVIGVDQDEYFSTFGEGETEGAEYLISSAMKRVDQGVYDLIEILYTNDEEAWPGGGLYVLSVENNGIIFAGPHDADIDEEFYEELKVVLQGLVEGEIETGVDPGSGELLEEMESDS